MDDGQVAAFLRAAAELGVSIQVFGQSEDNARAFWNWKFLDDVAELPHTRRTLMRIGFPGAM